MTSYQESAEFGEAPSWFEADPLATLLFNDNPVDTQCEAHNINVEELDFWNPTPTTVPENNNFEAEDLFSPSVLLASDINGIGQFDIGSLETTEPKAPVVNQSVPSTVMPPSLPAFVPTTTSVPAIPTSYNYNNVGCPILPPQLPLSFPSFYPGLPNSTFINMPILPLMNPLIKQEPQNARVSSPSASSIVSSSSLSPPQLDDRNPKRKREDGLIQEVDNKKSKVIALEDDQNQRMEKRKIKNRLSAQASRDRKKNYVTNLEQEISDLKAKNSQLASDLAKYEAENNKLRSDVAILTRKISILEKVSGTSSNALPQACNSQSNMGNNFTRNKKATTVGLLCIVMLCTFSIFGNLGNSNLNGDGAITYMNPAASLISNRHIGRLLLGLGNQTTEQTTVPVATTTTATQPVINSHDIIALREEIFRYLLAYQQQNFDSAHHTSMEQQPVFVPSIIKKDAMHSLSLESAVIHPLKTKLSDPKNLQVIPSHYVSDGQAIIDQWEKAVLYQTATTDQQPQQVGAGNNIVFYCPMLYPLLPSTTPPTIDDSTTISILVPVHLFGSKQDNGKDGETIKVPESFVFNTNESDTNSTGEKQYPMTTLLHFKAPFKMASSVLLFDSKAE